MEVASATMEKVESSRSMEHSPSKSSFDSASEASDQPDRADPSNSSPNPLKDVDFLQSPVALKSEEYRQLFRLPLEEVLVQDFNCAFQESILLQGHMYLFVHYVCFYSNIFGFETKKIIPFQEVTCVKRAKTAGIFPNAIEIFAGGKKYFFASFLSRDEAFKLINDGWSQHSNGVKAISEQQESVSDGCLENGIVADEEVKSSEQPVNELDSIDRNKDPLLAKDSKLPSDAEDDIVPITPADQQDNMEQNAESVPITDSSSSGNILLKQENSVAPKVPEYYSNVAEGKFPIKVEEFFTFFFSDDAVNFIESFHKRCGDKEFRCTSWSPHNKFGHARDVSFQHPIKLYFGAKFGSCQEVQKFRVYKDSHLIIETSQEVNDVPYGDYFTVEGLWDVESDGDESNEGCILRVYVNVAFSKKTMWKGKIVQSTVEECREAYANWITLAHEFLKQKNLEKQEEILTSCSIENGQVHLESEVEIAETSEMSHEVANSSKIPQMPDSRDINHGNLLQGRTIAPFSSLLSELMVKFSSSIKNQRHLQLLFLVTFVLILLLMQLSIVVLLARPQKVHLITQPEYMNGMDITGSGERSSEAAAWLDKRIHHLKDEIFMVEARIQRMQREYLQLKAQLKDLEHLWQLKKPK